MLIQVILFTWFILEINQVKRNKIKIEVKTVLEKITRKEKTILILSSKEVRKVK